MQRIIGGKIWELHFTNKEDERGKTENQISNVSDSHIKNMKGNL